MGRHIVSGAPAWVGAWVADKIGGCYREGDRAIGLMRDDGVLIAGVLYEYWNRRSIVAHIAIDAPITSAFLAAIFHYPFIVCDVSKVICPISTANPRSIRLASKMGFRQEARIEDAAPDGDVLFFTLTKSNCRFIEERYGKKCAVTASRT